MDARRLTPAHSLQRGLAVGRGDEVLGKIRYGRRRAGDADAHGRDAGVHGLVRMVEREDRRADPFGDHS